MNLANISPFNDSTHCLCIARVIEIFSKLKYREKNVYTNYSIKHNPIFFVGQNSTIYPCIFGLR